MSKRFLLCMLALVLCSVTFVQSPGRAADDSRDIKRNPGSGAAGAGKRVALIIGNGRYETSPLKNPVNDASDMSEVLKKVGFDVVLIIDGNKKAIRDGLNVFSQKLEAAEVGLFYFAGHGVSVEKKNYLIPVGVAVDTLDDVEDEAISADRVIARMRYSKALLNVVILDACRNNPFKFAATNRSLSGGLSSIQAPKGTIIAFATSLESVAQDGTGRNGTFTKHLLSALKMPGLDLKDTINEAGMGVLKETQDRQVPWISNTPVPKYYLHGNPATSAGSASPPAASGGEDRRQGQIDAEEEYWLAIKDSSYIGDFERYKKEYPNGRFAKVAALKADKLRQQAAAQTAPAKPVAASSSPPAVSSGASSSTPPSTYTDATTRMEFVFVPGGEFMMGSDNGIGFNEERPLHNVKVSEFYLGKYEVTQGEWEKVMGTNPSGFNQHPRYPVNKVSWNDVQEFIKKLNTKCGKQYRLPTEAEWEYAARSGGKNEKWAGTNDESRLEDYACYNKNSNGRIDAVGQKQANGLGLKDMSGNVWEWVQDCWHDSYIGAPSDEKSWESSCKGTDRAVRSGSCFHNPGTLRAAVRISGSPNDANADLGFRLSLPVQRQ